MQTRAIQIFGFVLCAAASFASGCTPGIYATKDPGRWNRGIRYYRPKPYLFLQPAGDAQSTEAPKATKSVDPAGGLYKLTLEYLPDFAEEYALRVRPGLGTAKVELKLENGWNLTSVNQDLDTKTAENVGALTNLIKEGAPFLAGAPQTRALTHHVRSNAPIGYYESVFTHDPAGRRQLVGFRYVGFMPFTLGPGASDPALCAPVGPAELYGLIADGDTLVFRPLAEFSAQGAAVPGTVVGPEGEPRQPGTHVPPAPPVTPGPFDPAAVDDLRPSTRDTSRTRAETRP